MDTLVIVGARPQFIKALVLCEALDERLSSPPVLLHTGQHYDAGMSAIFFEELGARRPDLELGIGSGSHADQTGQMLIGIEKVLMHRAPDLVVVIGDTNTTLAGALAAAKVNIEVAHVEAGLRSFNQCMPEEINRCLTDHVSASLFAPTWAAVENLAREGIETGVHQVGDVQWDAMSKFRNRAVQSSKIITNLGLNDRDYLLTTVHRAESTDNPAILRSIVEGLCEVARHIHVIFPLHPRTRIALTRAGLLQQLEAKVQVVEPLGFLDMMKLESLAKHIATDSGGVQKEAYFFAVPCSTLRKETEWVELVDSGWNHLVEPTDGKGLAEQMLSHLDMGAPADRDRPMFYGDGNAAGHISEIISGSQA